MKLLSFFLFFTTIFLIFTLAFWGCLFALYPKKYEKEVLIQSKEFNLSPALVFSVIKAESGFNPNAVSSAGAIGLMQIMPETAKWLVGSNTNLLNPAENIKIGCKYLAYLKEEFLDEATILTAYNAGPNKTKVWLEDERYGTASRTMRKTPYKETNAYVHKVLKYKKVYSFLYKF